MHWEKEDGPFPFGAIHGNFISSQARVMTESFLLKYCSHVESCAEKIIKRAFEINADILTKQRHTFCPFTNQIATAAVAYKRMYDFITENTGNKCISCLDL